MWKKVFPIFRNSRGHGKASNETINYSVWWIFMKAELQNKRKKKKIIDNCKVWEMFSSRALCLFVLSSWKKKKDTPGGLKDISPSPLGAATCPCGDIATTGLAEWEFKMVFANALLQFWSWWGEPWAKLGLSEWCLRGILRGPDNPFSLSSHRWVCSAAAPREITRLLSTYKIHLWNGMVLRQTCHSCSFFRVCVFVCVQARMCVAQKGCFFLVLLKVRGESKHKCHFQNLCSVFNVNSGGFTRTPFRPVFPKHE